MRLVIVATPADAADRASVEEALAQAPSVRRTASLTAFPSAFLPASFGMTAFMTLPMSFGRRGAGLRDGFGDGGLDLLGCRRRRQVGLKHRDFAGLFLDEIGAAGLGELLNRIAPLLDQRRHDLEDLRILEVASLLDALVHDGRLEHAQGGQP